MLPRQDPNYFAMALARATECQHRHLTSSFVHGIQEPSKPRYRGIISSCISFHQAPSHTLFPSPFPFHHVPCLTHEPSVPVAFLPRSRPPPETNGRGLW